MNTTTPPRITGDDLRLLRLVHRLRIIDVALAMDPPVSDQRAYTIERQARPSPEAASRYLAAVARAVASGLGE